MNERIDLDVFFQNKFFSRYFFIILSDRYLSSGQRYVLRHLFDPLRGCSEANKLVNNLPPTFLAGSFEPGYDGGNRVHAFWPRPSPSLPVI